MRDLGLTGSHGLCRLLVARANISHRTAAEAVVVTVVVVVAVVEFSRWQLEMVFTRRAPELIGWWRFMCHLPSNGGQSSG